MRQCIWGEKPLRMERTVSWFSWNEIREERDEEYLRNREERKRESSRSKICKNYKTVPYGFLRSLPISVKKMFRKWQGSCRATVPAFLRPKVCMTCSTCFQVWALSATNLEQNSTSKVFGWSVFQLCRLAHQINNLKTQTSSVHFSASCAPSSASAGGATLYSQKKEKVRMFWSSYS